MKPTWFQYLLTIQRTASSVVCLCSNCSILFLSSSSAFRLCSILSCSFLFWNLRTCMSISSWKWKIDLFQQIFKKAVNIGAKLNQDSNSYAKPTNIFYSSLHLPLYNLVRQLCYQNIWNAIWKNLYEKNKSYQSRYCNAHRG